MARNISRRAFLGGRQSALLPQILPPGVTAASLRACSGCGNCVSACPTQIISLVGGLPSIDFHRGECVFCGKCAEVCPEAVFEVGAALRFTHMASITDNCLARNRVACQSCRDACPEQAIQFAPRLGGPFLPVVNDDGCNGCGACISVCPVDAITVHEPAWEPANA